jgi:hypothetical protein
VALRVNEWPWRDYEDVSGRFDRAPLALHELHALLRGFVGALAPAQCEVVELRVQLCNGRFVWPDAAAWSDADVASLQAAAAPPRVRVTHVPADD